MEIHFPHLTNGIAVAPATKKHRKRSFLRILFAAVCFSSLLLVATAAFASTMNQEMIAQEEKLKIQVCYELQVDINRVMYGLFITEKIDVLTLDRAHLLESITATYSNYCKH